MSLLVSPNSAHACDLDQFNFVWGSDAGSHMTVRNGESCKFGFHVSSRGHMSAVAMTERPQHGTVSQVDATHWLYRPARGYTGPDAIIVKASGDQAYNRHGRISSGDTNITWNVDVTR